MVGQIVGKYRILSRLGRGGMGTVYRAVDETLHRDVAIKSLNPDLSDPEVLKRFRAEALTLARLNHPNIAMLFELTEHEGNLLMVMEFLGGETFEALSQRGPVPLERSLDLCSQVLDALAHAHRAGIVHRDLKPANLMLTEAGIVKVMDFGLARMAGTEHLTNDGFMIGTPAYMAPEQVLAEEIDGRADLYAMGVVLYRLLTSQLPFKADSGISMAHKQVHDAPTPVRTVRAELPAACEDIIGRALAKSPGDRFQTAEDFKAALAGLSVAGSGSTIGISVSGATRAFTPTPPPPVVIPDQPTIVLPARARKNISAAVAIGSLLLGAVLMTAYLVWRGQPSAVMPPAPPIVAAAVPSSSAPVSPSTLTTGAATTARAEQPPRQSPIAGGPRDTAPDSASEPAPARPPLPSVSFAQVKLRMLDEAKPHDQDVLVTFGADALDVLDGPTLITRARYQDVVGLFHSHSREPRWTKADGTTVSLSKVGGRFAFLKGGSEWITVQTAAGFIPLQVTDSVLARVISELETRTGRHVVPSR